MSLNPTNTHKNTSPQISQKNSRTSSMNWKLSNRTDPMAETTAFLTLKDHKPDFENHTKCRLINPAKSDVGKISKSILDTVNSKIRKQTGVNQWRNSSDTIAWFQSIPLKNRKSFISFDIVDFYPSITEPLLDQSIDWATQFTAITDSDIRIIKHARKSLLFPRRSPMGQTWFLQRVWCHNG